MIADKQQKERSRKKFERYSEISKASISKFLFAHTHTLPVINTLSKESLRLCLIQTWHFLMNILRTNFKEL